MLIYKERREYKTKIRRNYSVNKLKLDIIELPITCVIVINDVEAKIRKLPAFTEKILLCMQGKLNVLSGMGEIILSIIQKDIKKLWGKAASRCSICEKILINDENGEDALIGEMAHIIARKTEGPRGKEKMEGLESIDSYKNLILLCPTHHRMIDNEANLKEYTVKELLEIKKRHEQKMLSLNTDFEDEEHFLNEKKLMDIFIEFQEDYEVTYTFEEFKSTLEEFLNDLIKGDQKFLFKVILNLINSNQFGFEKLIRRNEDYLNSLVIFENESYFKWRDNMNAYIEDNEGTVINFNSDILFKIMNENECYWSLLKKGEVIKDLIIYYGEKNYKSFRRKLECFIEF